MNQSHFDRNRATRNQWDSFQPHRDLLTQLILDARPSGTSRLCVMGAGNCNDLNLTRLTQHFSRIVLIDLDDEAMHWGVAQQDAANIDTICRDVQTICAASDLAHEAFDVVVSSCLLSQMFLDIDPAETNDPAAYASIRRHHLLTMMRLLRTNGTGILVTDVVSSETCADLPDLSPAQLKVRLPQLIERQNFFTGTNPAVVHHLLTADPEFSAMICDVCPIDPWLWNPGPRTYACYGMNFRCR